MLLLRALVAKFSAKPYTSPLISWGNQLHDRFMLPYHIWHDMRWVVDDLQSAGLDFELDWLLPFKEFRFPHFGRVHIAGLQIDVHGAIEPWHVLGEEASAQSTSRYVDSSVERLQITVQGMSGERLALACNGRQIPLQPTDREGEFVGGIRYKAWAPPSALHPTIKVHTPLVIDVVDTLNHRSLGAANIMFPTPVAEITTPSP